MRLAFIRTRFSKLIFFISTIILFLNSCASSHSGVLSPNNNLRNVKYVDFAFGNVKTMTFLGFGGNKHDALVLEAKLNMMRNFPLKPNQFYGNFIVDYKTTKSLGLITNLVTVSADILEETSNSEEELLSESLKSKLGILKENDLFKLGDTVVDIQNLKYTVISNNSGTLVLYPIYTNEKRFSKMYKNENDVFSTKTYINYDTVITPYRPGSFVADGSFISEIIGINKVMYLLATESGVYYTKPIETIFEGKKGRGWE